MTSENTLRVRIFNSLATFTLLVVMNPVSAQVPYKDFLPDMPKAPKFALETDERFFSYCREEEAFYFVKYERKLYSTALFDAAQGDPKALVRIFRTARHEDGAGAESFAGSLYWLMHKAGDEKFAAALAGQPKKTRDSAIGFLDFATEYDYSGAFPKTFKLGRHVPRI